MDRNHWRIVLSTIKKAVRGIHSTYKPKRLRFADWLILAMFFWAVAHDRPQSWACCRENYSSVFRPRQLPSVSQFNRRMNHPRTRAIVQLVHEQLSGPLTATALTYLDGKPLTVGVASKDPDAKRGHVMGGFAKGYKLHAWMTEDRRIPLWCITPLNVHESHVAEALANRMFQASGFSDQLSDRSLVLADQNYDTHDLHKTIARYHGRLLVKPKGAVSGRRHPVTLRQMGQARRELLAVQRYRPSLLHLVHKQRVNAEGIFGNLTSYPGGLTGLPPWVRRLYRVRRWVGGKIILYHAHLRAKKQSKCQC